MVSEDELKTRLEEHAGGDVSNYPRWIDGEKGQPEELMGASIYRHGDCWRVELEDDEELPGIVKQLEKIALSGPALAILLESGCISYEVEKDRWTILEFTIPESRELPRQFRESIHLMTWRRESAVLPGQYILEEWAPDIFIGMDRIRFTLESQVTGERLTHCVNVMRGDLMHSAGLTKVLEREVKGLIEREGLEKDEMLSRLVQELIEEIVELEGESGPTFLKYEKLGKVSLGYHGRALEAIFVSDDDEMICIQLTDAIHVYLDWVKFSGGVDICDIENRVTTVLSQYDDSEDVILEIIRDVISELEDEGVVFREEN
jgi:hypothetical protein